MARATKKSPSGSFPFTRALLVIACSFGIALYLGAPPQHDATAYIYAPLKAIRAPVLTGVAFRAFVTLGELPILRTIVARKIMDDSKFWLPTALAARMELRDVVPLYHPYAHVSPADQRRHEAAAKETDVEGLVLGPQAPSPFSTLHDYATAYRRKTLNPVDVAKASLAQARAADAQEPKLRLFIDQHEDDILAQAQASATRFAQGTPRSIWDGVPVALKDEFLIRGYVNTGGTQFRSAARGTKPAPHDSTVAARLRRQGAIIMGALNMHEAGVGVTGLNPHHGFCRNPYGNASFITGGSSSGSAAAVAAGVVPVTVGADGGGSIRIPAAMCGVFGLKPTFGRVSDFGGFPLAWTVTHPGPLAATATDLAAGYMALAGVDVNDLHTIHQPPPHLAGFTDMTLTGLRVAVDRAWNAQADASIVAEMTAFEAHLVQAGATIVDIRIPHLLAMTRAHALTIASEFATALSRFTPAEVSQLALDTRVVNVLGNHYTARDYVAAQKIRQFAVDLFREHVFAKADVLLTPATGRPAARIPKAAEGEGMLDSYLLSKLMTFIAIPNFTGHPAVTIPIGYAKAEDGEEMLPVCAQFVANSWEEAVLLRLAHWAEGVTERHAPERFYDTLAAVAV